METTLPRLFRKVAREYPDIAFQMSRFNDGHFEPTTYKEAYENMVAFAGGLLSMGVQREEHIGLISDNRKEWQQADMGLLMIGAIDVPRGCDATIGDLEYILSFAECKIVIVENSSQVGKILGIREKLPLVTTLIEFEEPTDKDVESPMISIRRFLYKIFYIFVKNLFIYLHLNRNLYTSIFMDQIHHYNPIHLSYLHQNYILLALKGFFVILALPLYH